MDLHSGPVRPRVERLTARDRYLDSRRVAGKAEQVAAGADPDRRPGAYAQVAAALTQDPLFLVSALLTVVGGLIDGAAR
ncbi:hypothetical protein ACIA5D_49075 [Actinoplanes sp. NPDC051513]|uniref:hypothetical protein n=1 Tax=Actinoplanes sp. NPDC051513 TaxID=3363908 RepID=UPI0037B4D0DE